MNEFSLQNKKALITGPSKGLGQAIAVGLAKAGADIIGLDIGDMSQTQELVQGLGREFTGLYGDLGKTDQISGYAASALEVYGTVDILVNNAGVIYRAPAEEFPEEGYDFVMDINVKALFLLTRDISKQMKANRYGKIINICSIQSIQGAVDVSAYVASKHAVAGITRAFANELGGFGVNVNGIAPGFMITDNTEKLREQKDKVQAINDRIPMGRWGNPEDLAGPAVFLASDASAYVNGQLLVVDGGYLNN